MPTGKCCPGFSSPHHWARPLHPRSSLKLMWIPSESFLRHHICTLNSALQSSSRSSLSLWARFIGLFEFGSRFPTSSIIHFNLRKWWASSLFSCYRRRFTVLHNLRSEAGSLGFDVFFLCLCFCMGLRTDLLIFHYSFPMIKGREETSSIWTLNS